MISKERKLLTVLTLILLGALSRLIPHPYNLSAIGGLALFAGAQSKERPWLSLAPLFSLFLGDLFLGFHSTLPFVYGAFILNLALGYFLLQSQSVLRLFTTSLLASSLFFFVTNAGVWMVQSLYPKTFAGLLECYIAALPFFGATMTGDLVSTFGFFGLILYLERSGFFAKAEVQS